MSIVRAAQSKTQQAVTSTQTLMRKSENLSLCLCRKANPRYGSAWWPAEVMHRCGSGEVRGLGVKSGWVGGCV